MTDEAQAPPPKAPVTRATYEKRWRRAAAARGYKLRLRGAVYSLVDVRASGVAWSGTMDEFVAADAAEPPPWILAPYEQLAPDREEITVELLEDIARELGFDVPASDSSTAENETAGCGASP